MNYKIRRESPFPVEFRGETISGSYIEEDLHSIDSYRYIIIYPKPFDYERITVIQNSGINIYDMYPWMKTLVPPPTMDTHWIYELQRFAIHKNLMASSAEVADNAYDYSEKIFSDFNSLLDYCKNNYDVDFDDFRKKWETHFPD